MSFKILKHFALCAAEKNNIEGRNRIRKITKSRPRLQLPEFIKQVLMSKPMASMKYSRTHKETKFRQIVRVMPAIGRSQSDEVLTDA